MTLEPQAKLVDKETGEIIGYYMQAGMRRVALTLEKVKELKLDCESYIEFLELEPVEVLSYNGKFALLENVKYEREDYEALPFRREGMEVFIWGSCFDIGHLVTLDDDTAIDYALHMVDEESIILNHDN